MSNKAYGIVIVSHIDSLVEGLVKLLREAATEVSITYSGGTNEGEVGTSFEKINQAISENEADEIFAFYDLGSAKMNLEMVIEITDKKIHLMDTAMVEGAYTAAALTQTGVSFEEIMEQLHPLLIK